MHFAPSELLAGDAMVRELLRPFAEFLAIPGATEIVVNRPGELLVEAGPVWTRYAAPGLTLERCQSLANAIASYAGHSIDAGNPILSAQLPGGQRIQILVPPAAERDTVSITIRIPDFAVRSFDDYQAEGFFARYLWARPEGLAERMHDLQPVQQRLCALLQANRLADFLILAVQSRQNIVFVGDTGCGKTSLMKAACQFIPLDERLVTIEDVRELVLERHPNRVHLLYGKPAQGQAHASVTPSDLIASCMRMKPDRVLLAELRGGEAFDFLKLLTTGHSGSISSFHAESCALAFERYVFMCKEHEQAGIYDAEALKRLVHLTIDVIVHIRVERATGAGGQAARKERYISEVHYDPVAKLTSRFGGAHLYHGSAHV
ncbi:MAG: P-type DNA transfer ATPase VirB11 [Pseudomonadota bacterium]